MLKNILYTFFVVGIMVISATSCSKDSSPNESPLQSRLSGTWEIAVYTYEGQSSKVFPDDFEFTEFTGFGVDLNYRIVFTEDPNEYAIEGYYYLEQASVLEGVTTYSLFFNTYDDEGNFTIDDNIITLVLDGEEVQARISELTDDTLIFRVSTTTTEVEDDNFTTTTTITNETFQFERTSF